MRITEYMKFHNVMDNLSRAQDSYNVLMERMATQKKINRPSDDPVGTTQVLGFRTAKDSIEQYRRNIENVDAWLEMTETKLGQVSDLIAEAREAGINDQSSQTRQSLAQHVESLIQEVLSIANSKFGDRYLFAGTRTDTRPFARAILPVAASANTFDGAVQTGGAFTEAQEASYQVRIAAGGPLGTATFQVSADGGATWGAEGTVPASGTVTLGGGLTITFVDSGTADLAAGDLFYVNAAVGGATTAAAIDEPAGAGNNAFAGTVALDAATGTYAGATNRTYAVKFVNGGGAVGAADYVISSDGGKTWGATQAGAWGGTITLDATPGHEIVLNFTAAGPGDTLAENDLFYVSARAAGPYSGNGENLDIDIGRGNTMSYNVTGEEAFTDRGSGAVDLFGALESLKTALQNGDREAVIAQVDRLTTA